MCQLIYLASVRPLASTELLPLGPIGDPNQVDNDFGYLYTLLPDARYFYHLGGCQCHFRFYSEAYLEELHAHHLADGDAAMAESSRNYFRSIAQMVTQLVVYLNENLTRTPVWLVWAWEGTPVEPDCERRSCTPSEFLAEEFTMPNSQGVLELVADG